MDIKTELYTTLDKEAFSSLYKRYRPVLFRQFLVLLNSHEAVKDIIQEVFIRVWLKRDHIKPDASLKAYMYRIGHNLIIDHYRSVNREQRFADVHILYVGLNSSRDYELKEDKLQRLNKIIDKLPPKRKRVFELCKFEQKSYEEVSEILNISQATISDHIVKANSFIKMELNKDYNIAN